jgi:hypothetical protein
MRFSVEAAWAFWRATSPQLPVHVVALERSPEQLCGRSLRVLAALVEMGTTCHQTNGRISGMRSA